MVMHWFKKFRFSSKSIHGIYTQPSTKASSLMHRTFQQTLLSSSPTIIRNQDHITVTLGSMQPRKFSTFSPLSAPGARDDALIKSELVSKYNELYVTESLRERMESEINTSSQSQYFSLNLDEVREVVAIEKNKSFSKSLERLIDVNTLDDDELKIVIEIVDKVCYESFSEEDDEEFQWAEDDMREFLTFLKETHEEINHAIIFGGKVFIRSDSDDTIFLGGIGYMEVQSTNIDEQMSLVANSKSLLDSYAQQLLSLNSRGYRSDSSLITPLVSRDRVLVNIDSLRKVGPQQQQREKKKLMDISLGLQKLNLTD